MRGGARQWVVAVTRNAIKQLAIKHELSSSCFKLKHCPRLERQLKYEAQRKPLRPLSPPLSTAHYLTALVESVFLISHLVV